MIKAAFLSTAAAAAFALAASPAMAQDAGTIQVKVMGTAVLRNGEISRVEHGGIGLPAGT